MATSIPLIRSAVLAPMIRWLRSNGRPVRERLLGADLGFVRGDTPERPIPLASVFDFFRRMAEIEGPDIAARVINHQSLADLGNLGRVVLGARTPRDALRRVIAALPRYSTHELVLTQPRQCGLCVKAGWSLMLDDETMHVTQQFTAALIAALYAATDCGIRMPRSVRIRPHPRFGIEHLRPIFGSALQISEEATLEMELDDEVLDASLQFGSLPREEEQPSEWEVLKGDSSFSHSARLVLEALSDEPSVSVWRLARAAGMSTRSLQRVLTEEGTSFRQILDEVRRRRALEALHSHPRTIAKVSTDVGYTAQSSLSRAVRRWTGVTPKRLARIAPRGPVHRS